MNPRKKRRPETKNHKIRSTDGKLKSEFDKMIRVLDLKECDFSLVGWVPSILGRIDFSHISSYRPMDRNYCKDPDRRKSIFFQSSAFTASNSYDLVNNPKSGEVRKAADPFDMLDEPEVRKNSVRLLSITAFDNWQDEYNENLGLVQTRLMGLVNKDDSLIGYVYYEAINEAIQYKKDLSSTKPSLGKLFLTKPSRAVSMHYPLLSQSQSSFNTFLEGTKTVEKSILSDHGYSTYTNLGESIKSSNLNYYKYLQVTPDEEFNILEAGFKKHYKMLIAGMGEWTSHFRLHNTVFCYGFSKHLWEQQNGCPNKSRYIFPFFLHKTGVCYIGKNVAGKDAKSTAGEMMDAKMAFYVIKHSFHRHIHHNKPTVIPILDLLKDGRFVEDHLTTVYPLNPVFYRSQGEDIHTRAGRFLRVEPLNTIRKIKRSVSDEVKDQKEFSFYQVQLEFVEGIKIYGEAFYCNMVDQDLIKKGCAEIEHKRLQTIADSTVLQIISLEKEAKEKSQSFSQTSMYLLTLISVACTGIFAYKADVSAKLMVALISILFLGLSSWIMLPSAAFLFKRADFNKSLDVCLFFCLYVVLFFGLPLLTLLILHKSFNSGWVIGLCSLLCVLFFKHTLMVVGFCTSFLTASRLGAQFFVSGLYLQNTILRSLDMKSQWTSLKAHFLSVLSLIIENNMTFIIRAIPVVALTLIFCLVMNGNQYRQNLNDFFSTEFLHFVQDGTLPAEHENSFLLPLCNSANLEAPNCGSAYHLQSGSERISLVPHLQCRVPSTCP